MRFNGAIAPLVLGFNFLDNLPLPFFLIPSRIGSDSDRSKIKRVGASAANGGCRLNSYWFWWLRW